MSEEMITMSMFKLLKDSQDKMISAFMNEIKEVNKELQQTNSLLREDINTTKLILAQSVKEHKEHRADNDKKFSTIFGILRAREGLYTTAKWIKVALGIVLAGMLTAAGSSMWTTYTKGPEQSTKSTKVEMQKGGLPQ